MLNKGNKTTYRELNKKANKLANYLRNELSVKPGDIIGIMLERTELMVITMLGVLRSGAAYVGIDTAYPQKRIDYLIKNSKAKILVTDQTVLRKDSFKVLDGTLVIDIEDVSIAHQKSNEPVKITSLDDTAYIIYTSGSTGEPKGVTITHKNLLVLLHWCFIEFSSTKYDITYANTSYCFDLSIFEIFYSLAAGKNNKDIKIGIGNTRLHWER